MGKAKEKLKGLMRGLRASSRFHGLLTFLVFLGVAIIFWFIMALNDSVTETFRVKLHIDNVPDTVTFITDPPTDIHITLRDKGTNLIRSLGTKEPTMTVNFRDYSEDGTFRLTRSDINSVIKSTFGNSVQISAVSIDSLRLYYTTSKGKRVPVVVKVEATAASGYIISGHPTAMERAVRIFSRGDETDTISNVTTERVVKRDLSQTSYFDVKIRPIPNVKIIPSTVRVKVPVEPLVKKETLALVEAVNVPQNQSLLLFPNRVPVSCYVPMSAYNDEQIPVKVYVDYADAQRLKGNKLPVSVNEYPRYVVNIELNTDSVEYTVVKH